MDSNSISAPPDVFKQEGFAVVCVAAVAAVTGELLSYLLFFSSQAFKDLHSDIIQLSRKLHRQQQLEGGAGGGGNSLATNRKTQTLEKEVQKKHREAASTRQKAHLLSGLLFMVLMPYLYTKYEGLVVARLPVEPIFPLRLMTHATISGTDFSECSFTFIFTTTMFLVKSSIQRLLGYAPPPGAAQQGRGFGGATTA
eukprot:GHVS01054125.1.p1 GENE.GHVS01054125.1~~GHVS01054125.1.p1  ORF type:complete len:197 (+),score=30.61 GHVS01054125.1:906-1496(+)